MMKPSPFAFAAVAFLSLAACENKPEEVDSRAPDPMAEALKNAPKIELPPAVVASKTLRCGDNSLLYVEFFKGDTQINIRTEKGGKAIMLKAPAAGEPFVAEGGYKLTGTPKSVEVTLPGKGSKTCHA